MFWIFTICFLENIWKTDLDFMVPYRNRLQILHVLTGGTINASLTTTQAPYHHPAAKIREYLDGNYSQNPKPIYMWYTYKIMNTGTQLNATSSFQAMILGILALQSLSIMPLPWLCIRFDTPRYFGIQIRLFHFYFRHR